MVPLKGQHDSIQSLNRTDSDYACANSLADCVDGDIRLDAEGRVEMCIYLKWKIVCGDEWTHGSAAVVCGQLGFSSDGETLYNYR